MLKSIASAFAGGKTLEGFVEAAQSNPPESEVHRKAIWGIREFAEKTRNPEAQLIRAGAIKVLVASILSGSSEEKLWSLFVLRVLSVVEIGASMVLQEPQAIEALIDALANSSVGSEQAKRSVEIFQGLAQHLSTQILLAREDVYKAMVAAMNAQPPEAKVALQVYALLSEVESGAFPSYAKKMTTEKAVNTLNAIAANTTAYSQVDRDLAKRVLAHITS